VALQVSDTCGDTSWLKQLDDDVIHDSLESMSKQGSGTFYVHILWQQIFSGHTHLEGLKLCFVAHGGREPVT